VPEDDVSRMMARHLQQSIDGAFIDAAFGGVTSTVASAETTLDIKKVLPEWMKILRNARRTQVTFVVDMGHEGPMLKTETPCDGTRFEMNFRQAQELHRQWPIRLVKVLTKYSAEFVPASGVLSEFVPRVIPQPPFENLQEGAEESSD
jgi:hypothetical protein